jgi:hypothetical protein
MPTVKNNTEKRETERIAISRKAYGLSAAPICLVDEAFALDN